MLTELLLQSPKLTWPTTAASSQARAYPVDNVSASGQASTSKPAYILDLSTASRQTTRMPVLGDPDLEKAESEDSTKKNASSSLSQAATDGKAPGASGSEDLSEDDQRKVDELEKIDKEVHTHEQAHLAAAGGYARGGANYSFVTGPDGDRYAVGGHVNMDTGSENSPEETLRKAAVVRKAALAPANPSSSDRQIAANMSQMAQEARSQIAQENQQANQGAEKGSDPAKPQDAVQESNPNANGKGQPETDNTSALRRGTYQAAISAYQAYNLNTSVSGATFSLVA